MLYRIRHTTEYQYQEIVSTGHNRLCLVPLTHQGQRCESSNIRVHPVPDEVTYLTDYFGNTLLFVSIYKEHDKLEINSESLVDTKKRINGELAEKSPMLWKEVREKLYSEQRELPEIAQYILPSLHVPYSVDILRFAQECFPPSASLWSGCLAITKKIYGAIEFKPGFTTVNTPVESVLKSGRGVCQDFAHLMIACLRNIGLPARYVSGYIETLPPPGKEKLIGTDASHAWVAVFFPGIGWVEFDPTNNSVPGHQHITVGFGRDYFDVAPIKGIIFSSGNQEISVRVDVNRV